MPLGNLFLELVSASGLLQANPLRFVGFKQDPYCQIRVDEKRARSRTHNNGGRNPVWNESFHFDNITHFGVIKISIFDENTLTSDRYIGDCVIDLEDVVRNGGAHLNVPVLVRQRNSPNATLAGSLALRLQWTFIPSAQVVVSCRPIHACANHTAPHMPAGPQVPIKSDMWILPDPDVRQQFKDKYMLPDHRKPLGKGSYGETHRVINRLTGQEYACKIITKHSIFSQRMEDEMRNEIKILNHLCHGHPNIINVEEVIEDVKRIYIVMELCRGGELYDHIIKRSHYSEADAAALIYSMLDVVQYCHNAGVVHRDLKPENFLFTSRGGAAQLKLIDFGLGRFITGNEELYDVVGSAYYIAPETARAKRGVAGYGKECDIWSCGVILYILLSGMPPFGADCQGNEHAVQRSVLTQELDLKSAPWDNISKEAKRVVAMMLERDTRKRAKIKDLLRDPWIMGNAPKTPLRNMVVDRMRKFANGNKLQRRAILMVAQELPANEVEGLRTMFKKMDTDKNGVITIDELRRALVEMGSKLPMMELSDIMELADVDGDGVIDVEEFIAAIMNHSRMLRRDRVLRVFEQLDEDGSGFLDRNELARAFQELNVQDIDAAMREADQDGDGMISFEEFFAMMTRDI